MGQNYCPLFFKTVYNKTQCSFHYFFLSETHNPRESGLIAFGWYVGIGISQSCPRDSIVEYSFLGGEKHVPPEPMVKSVKISSLQAKCLK